MKNKTLNIAGVKTKNKASYMHFYHSGAPIAKKRHRMANGIAYDTQSKIKRNLKWEFAAQFRNQGYLKPICGPIACHLDISVQIPASWSKKRKKAALSQFVTSRPDLDNYEKMYLDVLNKIAYEDDSQIASIISNKRYNNKPGVSITLIPLEDNKMINEHAIVFKDKLNDEEINYIVKKANRLGLSNRQIIRVSKEEETDGTHLYFWAEGLKEKCCV